MPTAEWRQESNYGIPEDTPCPAELSSVEKKTLPSRDRDTKQIKLNPKTGEPETYDKWIWSFRVTDGPYQGITVDGWTQPYISPHANNKVRLWSQLLRDKDWVEGEGINTDDLIGFPCVITVKHQQPREKKSGDGMWYGLEVADVFPANSLNDLPPF